MDKDVVCVCVCVCVYTHTHTHTMEYYSPIRKRMAATWMNLEIILLSEVSQKDIYDITYTWNQKKDTDELIYRTNRLTDIENKFVVSMGERWGRDKLGVWD